MEAEQRHRITLRTLILDQGSGVPVRISRQSQSLKRAPRRRFLFIYHHQPGLDHCFVFCIHSILAESAIRIVSYIRDDVLHHVEVSINQSLQILHQSCTKPEQILGLLSLCPEIGNTLFGLHDLVWFLYFSLSSITRVPRSWSWQDTKRHRYVSGRYLLCKNDSALRRNEGSVDVNSK